MHILNDFFLLSWNEKLEHIDKLPDRFSDYIYNYSNYSDFCDSSAILLMINSENCDSVIKLNILGDLFDGVFKDISLDRCLILQAQKELLVFLVEEGNIELNKDIKSRFEILRKEGVITYFISRRLIGLIGLIKEKQPKEVKISLKKAQTDNEYYRNSLNILKTAIYNLKEYIEPESLKPRLDFIVSKLENQKFSIGITGVMNAGKSTMLNALLKKEILGTSTVPETANLTVLKYADIEFARVNFWSKSEFERIIKSSESSKSIKKFVEETKEHFGSELGKYITKSGNSKEIAVDELVFYTSAKKSDKKCNLVKSVELYSNLEFLKNGVEIVDTPGLDDPIVQREEITLDYLNDCDLMCHLMNVNQSATKKDIDFIIDSILYNNIARLLIVITRIDTVDKKELNEVIEYTKNSIVQRLKELNKESLTKSIINKIDFIPLSAKMALLHRIGKAQEALKKGYSLDKTGILNFEEYLKKTLFGKNSPKADLIIQSNSKELKSIIQNTKNLLLEEKRLLGKSNSEIQKEMEIYKSKKTELVEYIEKLKQLIQNHESSIKSYLSTLDKFVDERLIYLRDLIKQRVLDDVSYEVRKNSTLPERKRIDYIVGVGVRDGVVDLIRDYKYEFQKRLQKSFEAIKRSFNDFQIEEEITVEFDTKEFFEKHFKSFSAFVHKDLFLNKIDKLIKKYGKKDINILGDEITKELNEEVKEIGNIVKKKLENINRYMLDSFIGMCKTPLEQIEEDIRIKEEIIENTIRSIGKSSRYKKQRLYEIEAKLEAYEQIESDLDTLEGIKNESA